ncbi:MAG: ral transcriptional co-repressor, acts together with Tup1p, glucose repression mediator protein [Candidatus Taylorbacteria bacterium]|nr:ral transcriptional co-repressor, acts together with Tup1p, glucose repression mediator protein [Candidatus Taylorbacteria bacterium]
MHMKTERLSVYALLALVLITPLIFMSPTFLLVDYAKVIAAAICIFVSALSFLHVTWMKKSISIPKHPLVLSMLAIDIVALISAFAGGVFKISFFGSGAEIDTVSMLLLATLALVLVVMTSQSVRKLSLLYRTLIISFGVIFIYQALRLFVGPEFLSFGIFTQPTSSILGKWHEISIFGGLVLTVFVTLFEYVSIKPSIRWICGIGSLLTLGLMMASGFAALWIILAIIMLIIVISKYAVSRTFAPYATAGFVLAMVFALAGAYTVKPVMDHFHITETEPSLTWQTTIDVAAGTIKNSPLFGAGPNHFVTEYSKFKPAEIGASSLWFLDFFYGVGLIPTFGITTGVLGFIAWIIFMILLIKETFSALKRKFKDEILQHIVVSSVLGSLFLWLTAFVYVPSQALWFIMFIITGAFVAAATLAKASEGKSASSSAAGVLPYSWNLNWREAEGRGIAVSIITAIVAIILVIWAIAYIRSTVARAYFQSGIQITNSVSAANASEMLPIAEKTLADAIRWNDTDTYERSLALAYTLDFQNTLSMKLRSTSTLTAADSAQISALAAKIVDTSNRAIALDPENYANYFIRARISEVFAQAKVDKAYETTLQAYDMALKHNPHNPSIFYSVGLFEMSLGHDDQAAKYFINALQMKRDYADAAMQLGLVYYRNKSYANAAEAFKGVIDINSNYQNIHYYYALTLARLGKTADAVAELELAAKANPNEPAIAAALADLKAGKNIFTDTVPQPVAPAPVKETKAPVVPKKK